MYRRTLSYYCEPDIDESVGGVHFQNLIHPLIDEDVAVPNDLNLDNHILLTGSNASGKSTFMKAVALNIIMSQSFELQQPIRLNANLAMFTLLWPMLMTYCQAIVTLWLN